MKVIYQAKIMEEVTKKLVLLYLKTTVMNLRMFKFIIIKEMQLKRAIRYHLPLKKWKKS